MSTPATVEPTVKLVHRRLESDSETGRLDDHPTRRPWKRINERHQRAHQAGAITR